jgi:dynein heavy chain 1
MTPLQRFFMREHDIGKALLETVRSDLQEVAEICHGHAKQSNHSRALLTDLSTGKIPSSY